MVGFRNRYMVMEVVFTCKVGEKDPIILTLNNVGNAVRDSIALNFGECGLASSHGSFQVKYVNPYTKVCIIRMGRQEWRKVHSAVTLVTAIANCPLSINLLVLTGCIRNCRKRAVACEESKIKQYKLLHGDADEPLVRTHVQKIRALES